MSITLTAAVTGGDSAFFVNGAPPVTTRPFLAQIGAEQVLVDAGSATIWGPVHRGQNGTIAAMHLANAVITPLYGVESQTAPGATPLVAGNAIVAQEITFTEAGAGTYTGTVVVPAGATVLDLDVRNTVVWAAGTSASLIVGDDDDANGYVEATDVKAAPAADTNGAGAGFSTALSLGASAGVYKGGAGKFCAVQKTITATIVSVGAGTAGRTRVLVKYALPSSVAATKA